MEFKVYNLSCASCVNKVEKAVKAVSGIKNVNVNLLLARMSVDGDKSLVDTIIKSVENAGYRAVLVENNDNSNFTQEINNHIKALKQRFFISLILLIPLLILSMKDLLGISEYLPLNHTLYVLILAILSLAIIIINKTFFINGFRAIFHLSPNMDSLVALGAGSAYLYSLFAFLINLKIINFNSNLNLHYFFESTGMILTLITLGKMLEAIAKGKSTTALKDLYSIMPKSALVEKEGKLVEIPANKLNINDIFILKEGAKVPTDALIIEGEGLFDESSLTGEPIPVKKVVDNEIFGACILVNGYLKCKVTKTYTESSFSKIIELVKETSQSKAPIARIADRICEYFVPFVILVAIITFGYHFFGDRSFEESLIFAVSVLLISCPCALGLATPVSIMCASFCATKNSILFKNATALEVLGKINAIIFDKTGTITQGKPLITNIKNFSEKYSISDILSISKALEEKSNHPISNSFKLENLKLSQFLKDLNYKIDSSLVVNNFRAINGFGIIGEVNQAEVLLGNLDLLKNYSKISQEKFKEIENHVKQNFPKDLDYLTQTLIHLSINNEYVGYIIIADNIIASSYKTFELLKKQNISLYILTGAHISNPQDMAKELGVDKVIAQCKPTDKANFIKELQKQNQKVAFIGDGINDALALTQSDVAITIKRGSDIAIEQSDIILMKDNLLDILKAIKLSTKTLHNIYQNLFWAFIYNVIGIPLAAGVFTSILWFKFNPIYSAIAMSLSSICVISNALRLRFINLNQGLIESNDNSCSENSCVINEVQNLKENNMIKNIHIEGMMCQNCEKHVLKALGEIKSIKVLKVSKDEKLAQVEVVDKSVDLDTLNKTLTDTVVEEGYQVTKID